MLRLFILFTILLEAVTFAQPTLTFGVFAYRSKTAVEEQYRPLITYLNTHQNDYHIEMVALERDEFEYALNRNQLDIISTNPSHYEIIRNNNFLSRIIATTVQIEGGIPTDSFGGVIFTSSANPSIHTIADLKGKSIALTDPKSLGAYQAQAYEFMVRGIDVTRQAKLHVQKKQEDIVQAVMSGKVQAGFVRTGILESLIKEGKIDKRSIRIINLQNMSYFPYLLSTRLYPEWPVAILPHVDEEFAKKFTILLLSFEPEKGKNGSVVGFTLPQNYQPIEQLAKTLHFPPYDKVQTITLKEVYLQYRSQIFGALFTIIMMFIAIIYIMRLNLRIRSSEERFSIAIEGSNDGLFDWNMIDNTMFHSKNFETMLGYNGDELPQTIKAWEDNIHPDDLQQAHQAVEAYLKLNGKGTYKNTFRMRAKDGSWRWIEGRGKAMFDANHKPVRFIGFNTDITATKENELLLEHAAGHDMLTNLPNRTLLSNLMPQILASTARRHTHAALLFLDLDGFKAVNDTYGHEMGDLLLKMAAIRMQSLIRNEDVAARLGGDEFALLIPELSDRSEINHLVSRLLKVISEPYLIEENELYVSASIGISFYPQEYEVDADTLLRQADQAMYDAKMNGKNQYYYFDEVIDHTKKAGNDRIGRIKSAIDNGELVLHYQPKVNMCNGEIIGAEALVRWDDPQNGLVYPDHFLPFIENRPPMFQLDTWVLHHVFEQIAQWNAQERPMRISINISAYTFKQNTFIPLLKNMFQTYPDVLASQIELEILETSALHNIAEVQQIIASLYQLGITVSLDDFGTGYASLSYLKKLEVDYLKIDKSFVMDILNDSGDLRILEATLGLADAFRSHVIAEGVESAAHGDLLIQFGCCLAQGYTIGRPMLPEAFIEWSQTWKPYPSWQRLVPIAQKYFPLLYAGTEHRQWFALLQSFLNGSSHTPPQKDHTLCQFGKWLHSEGEELIDSAEEYNELYNLHHQMHELSGYLVQASSDAEIKINEELFRQLHTLHADLLNCLQKLIKKDK